MKTAMLSLQALLCSPEPNDPQDAVVATMYKEKHEEFVSHAKFWTDSYAKPEGSTAEVRLIIILLARKIRLLCF